MRSIDSQTFDSHRPKELTLLNLLFKLICHACFGVDISLQCNSCFQQDSEKRREKRNSEMMDSELKMANEVFMKVSKEVSL